MKQASEVHPRGAERLLELAHAEALRVHSEATNHGWRASNGHTYGDWTKCPHPDCVLVRSGDALQTAPASPNLRAEQLAIDGDNDQRAAWMLEHEEWLRYVVGAAPASPPLEHVARKLLAAWDRDAKFEMFDELIEELRAALRAAPRESINETDPRPAR